LSNLTLLKSKVGLSPDPPAGSDLGQQAAYVSVGVRTEHDGQYADAWQQVNDGLRAGLERSGFRQTDQATEAAEPRRVVQASAVVVAPGIMVRPNEYEERYGGIDLEGLRDRMTPALFRAFVRHIGAVPGRPDLDVNEIARMPEDH